MSERTGITWTDHTFNPWHGCMKVSAGCQNCYALSFSERTGHGNIWGPAATTPRRFFSDEHWREPTRFNAAAREAGVRRRVFSASMADVFEDHPDVGPHRARLWQTIEATDYLDWQLLTKRPENVTRMVPCSWLDHWPRHVWIGTSVEHQPAAEARLPHLLAVPAQVRFLSVEPMLGPVSLFPWLPGVDWVIVGGESGPNRRPFDLAWLVALVAECRAAGIPVFVKQDAALRPGQRGRVPADLWVHEFPEPA
jgi:protein gp37